MGDEKFDAVLLSLAQQHACGVPELIDTIFSFFQRKTDFFTGGKPGEARDMLLRSFSKFEARAVEELRKKREADEKRKQQQRQEIEEAHKVTEEDSKPKVYEITDEEEKKN